MNGDRHREGRGARTGWLLRGTGAICILGIALLGVLEARRGAPSQELADDAAAPAIPDRFAEVRTPAARPPAVREDRAKREEGKVGKRRPGGDPKTAVAEPAPLDREIAEAAGVLAGHGGHGLSGALTGGVGGVLGRKSVGASGSALGSRGSGIGGGGGYGSGAGSGSVRVEAHGRAGGGLGIPGTPGAVGAAPEAALSAAPPPASAPRIRAGVTDDNAAFDAYLAFLGPWSDRGDTVGSYRWIPVRDRRRITVRDADGEPVPHAIIEVIPGGAAPSSVARTYGDGATHVYPRLEGLSQGGTVRAHRDRAWASAHWDGRSDLVLTLDGATDPPGSVPLDVALIIDTTGSMADEILAIKQTLRAVVRDVTASQGPVDLRFGAVLYRDRRDAYVTRTLDFTSDIDAFDGTLRGIEAGGGGDHPESLNAGLRDALNGLAWRTEAAKVGFLIADAPPHLDYDNDTPYDTSARQALREAVRLHTVAASGLDATGSLVFRQIAHLSRGKFVYIEYGSRQASAAKHGVDPSRSTSNNLDRILADQIRAEIEGYGVASD